MAAPDFPDLSWQPSLLDSGVPASVDEAFAGLERIQLDVDSWVDHAAGWVRGADGLFAQLVTSTDWGQRERWMYTRRVQEPRLTSHWRADSGLPLTPPVLEALREVLSGRYRAEPGSV